MNLSLIEALTGAGFQPHFTLKGDVLIPETLRWPEIAEFLRNTDGFYFDMLHSLSGVDAGTDGLYIVYHLSSLTEGLELTVKCFACDFPEFPGKPSVPSVASVWRTAEWHEREAYDLFGIHFIYHPDLRRMFMPEDWVGHPLLKNYVPDDEYHGIKVAYNVD